MGKIMMNGIPYASTYDNATSVKYDNTKSQLDATNVQDAIDEATKDLQEHRNDFIYYKNNISNPNLLINGDFQVNQRGQDSYTNNGTTRMYTVDRWCIGNGATLGVNNGYIQVSTTRDGYLLQSLETAVNGVHTLSLYVKDVSGVVSVYFSGVESGVKTEKTLEVGLNVLTVEDNNIKEVVIEFKESNSSVSIEWVKLEKGSIATPLIPRQYAEELMLCQRYYIKGQFVLHRFFNYGNGAYLYVGQLQTLMRTKPSANIEYVKLVNGYGTGFNVEYTALKNFYESSYYEIQFKLPSGETMQVDSTSAETTIAFDAEIY